MEDDKKLQKAQNNAYSLLRARPRSEAEMRTRLKRNGHAVTAINAVIGSLKAAGELDDERFARLWIESRMQINPMGEIVLRRELKEKGVSEPIIEATLAERAERYDDYKVAFGIAAERLKQLAKLDKKKALKRLYDFLLRRGFSYDIVERVIGGLIHEHG